MKLKNILLTIILLTSITFANEIGKPFVQIGHVSAILASDVSPDEKYIASGGNGNVIKIWDIKTAKEIKTLYQHNDRRDWILFIKFSSDGKYIISADSGRDSEIKYWNLITGKIIKNIKLTGVTTKVISNKKYLVVLESNDKYTASIFNIKTGKKIKEFSINRGYIGSAVISNNSNSLIIGYGGDKNGIIKYNINTGKIINIYKDEHLDTITTMITSHNDKILISGSDDKTIKIWDNINGNILKTLHVNYKDIKSLYLTKDNNKIFFTSFNKVILWDIPTSKELNSFEGHKNHIFKINMFIDEESFITASADGTLKLWNIYNSNPILNFRGKTSEIYSMAILNNKLISHNKKRLKVWNLSNGKQIKEFLGNNNQITSISTNKNKIIVGGFDTSVNILNFENGKIIKKFKAEKKFKDKKLPTLRIRNKVIFSNITKDNKYIISVQYKIIQIINNKNGKLIHTLSGHKGGILSISFNSNGSNLISSDKSGTIKIWNIKTGKNIFTFTEPKNVLFPNIFKFLITKDDNYIFYTIKNAIRMLDINNKKIVKTFKLKTTTIYSLALSKNQKYMITGDQNKNVNLWDIEKKEIIKTFKGHSGEIYNVSFINNDKKIISGGSDGVIKIWDIEKSKEIIMLVSFNDGEWLSITPNGFFDSSKNGAKYLNILTNQLNVTSIDKFYNTFYRPDLIQKVLNGEDISKFIKDINLNKIIQDGSAPIVSIKTSSQKSKKRDINLKLEVCTIDDGGYDNLTLYLNDRAVDVISKDRALKLQKQSKTRKECFTISKLISLQNGKNKIGFKATNKAGTIESNLDEIVVNYKGRSDTKPNLYILSIGVDKYRDGDLQLKYSKADANAFAEVIQKVSNPLFKNIYTYQLLDKDVTKSKVLEMFKKIGKKTTREDVFIFYMAGHGITDAKTGAYFYLPVDFRYKNENSVRKKGLSQNDFKLALSKIQAMKSLTILDTCNSGSFSEAMASRGVLQKTAINKLTRATGRATIVA
ncbi:MAG: hypothetical protein DRG78_13150, partial [Epsilonproteobacteria bacterium]